MTSFTAVPARRTTDQVVDQIRTAIADGAYVHGQRLPAERVLADTFEVSRGVIREAIKILNGMGLIESRQGSGIYVHRDPVPAISRALTLTLRREEHMVQQLFEIRAALETLAARSAAARHTPEDIASLRKFASAIETPDAALNLAEAALADKEFHLAVGRTANNAYLLVLLQAVQELFMTTFPISEKNRTGLASATRTHSLITDAIEAGDGERASTLMAEHIGRSELAARQSIANDE